MKILLMFLAGITLGVIIGIHYQPPIVVLSPETILSQYECYGIYGDLQGADLEKFEGGTMIRLKRINPNLDEIQICGNKVK